MSDARFIWKQGDVELGHARAYNPNEARIPKGPGGGEWTAGGAPAPDRFVPYPELKAAFPNIKSVALSRMDPELRAEVVAQLAELGVKYPGAAARLRTIFVDSFPPDVGAGTNAKSSGSEMVFARDVFDTPEHFSAWADRTGKLGLFATQPTAAYVATHEYGHLIEAGPSSSGKSWPVLGDMQEPASSYGRFQKGENAAELFAAVEAGVTVTDAQRGFVTDMVGATEGKPARAYNPNEARRPKGDKGGGQWTAGASMQSNAEAYLAAGNRLVVVNHDNALRVAELWAQTQKLLEARRPFETTGDVYTGRALDYAGVDEVRVAQAKGGTIAGAIQWDVAGGTVRCHYLGSTGIAPGTGSALVRSMFRAAARDGHGISLVADYDAVPFWRKMGFETTTHSYLEGTLGMSMTAEEVRGAIGP